MCVDARLDVNVAVNRPSYQVSMFSTEPIFYASYANDGNHDTDAYTGPCAHTDPATNPWWAVDLGVALHVFGVEFTNRNSFGQFYRLLELAAVLMW